MKDPHDVVIRPVVSEKTYQQNEANNTYTFVVAPKASKPEIALAIEAIFDGVKVSKVNTLNRKGKRVRNRKTNTKSTRSTTKRAIVTLSEGEIELFTT
ncbi:MAG: 50S ribosomal protein L23 [Acidimicrobiia bacterium]|jgi:large subunit ribosomal protein L23|nr:50S ribosomal protein L23 [Acidimicrobiia bacterium]MDH5291245.1 50S ribosomal protein L23 [Acidimicrobiia bacterium]